MLDLELIKTRIGTITHGPWQTYPRENAVIDILALIAEVERLHQREAMLIETLGYYTQEKIYTWLPYRHSCRGPTRYTAPSIISDGGRKAKKALAELKNEDTTCLI